MIRRVTVSGSVKDLRSVAIGKPSLNRATNWSLVVDAKLHELPMSRLNRGSNRVEDRTHLG